jgi:enamine deaminase RidA (YjgF/YER057c/UK114 family)
MKTLQPPGWSRPSGYVHGLAGSGTTVFVSGQIGWDERGEFVSDDLAEQVAQALRNVVRILAEAGAGPEHIARMTWYLTDRLAYRAALPAIGAAYRSVMGRHFAAMSVVEVSALMEDRALVEIEVTALVPAP